RSGRSAASARMTGSALAPAGRGQSLIEPARHDHPMRTAIPRPHQARIKRVSRRYPRCRRPSRRFSASSSATPFHPSGQIPPFGAPPAPPIFASKFKIQAIRVNNHTPANQPNIHKKSRSTIPMNIRKNQT
ncbi:hypothetical protein, partial [Burkholderia thailandensis]|uniref:hypothetical protein n=2 Tax=Burkholderia thailandensis TaxID=57975 RepID=UPI001E52BF54